MTTCKVCTKQIGNVPDEARGLGLCMSCYSRYVTITNGKPRYGCHRVHAGYSLVTRYEMEPYEVLHEEDALAALDRERAENRPSPPPGRGWPSSQQAMDAQANRAYWDEGPDVHTQDPTVDEYRKR